MPDETRKKPAGDAAAKPTPPQPQSDSPKWKNWVGVYFIVMCVVLVILLFALWPVPTLDRNWRQDVSLFGVQLFQPLGDEIRLLLIVVVTGALGSYIHASTSFVTFVGNRSLVSSWLWWYLLRPFIGMALALIVYFAVRGGLLAAGTDATDVSAFGAAAVAGLVGMFSKQATDKLREVFDTLFHAKNGDQDRTDKVHKDDDASGE